MWFSILLFSSLVICLRWALKYGIWSDVTFIASSVPWYGLASGVLFIRHHQALLSRVAYMLLLFYWFIWVSGGGIFQNFRYTQVLGELMRSRSAKGGERDEFGRHWTINIAEFFINNALNELLDYFLPTWVWSRTVFHVVLTLFVFGHSVVQLFLQKQITGLMRLDRATFKWRDYGIEYCCYAVIRQLDNRVTRALVHMWW